MACGADVIDLLIFSLNNWNGGWLGAFNSSITLNSCEITELQVVNTIFKFT